MKRVRRLLLQAQSRANRRKVAHAHSRLRITAFRKTLFHCRRIRTQRFLAAQKVHVGRGEGGKQAVCALPRKIGCAHFEIAQQSLAVGKLRRQLFERVSPTLHVPFVGSHLGRNFQQIFKQTAEHREIAVCIASQLVLSAAGRHKRRI